MNPIRNLKDTNDISVTKNGCVENAKILSALEAAEKDIRNGKVCDAFEALKEVREKYGF
ncbi:MAG: hypothetical protein K6F82_00280 [Sphaerochaetaceae bacterium]|nr:hypothetical protein [Sphaerochaetaceae bacterium]